MRKIFFIAIGLFVFMLSACRSHRQASTSSATDSTSVTFREVEKIVHIPGDSVKVTMSVETRQCLDSTTFIPQTQTIETKRTKVTIELTRTGEIKATAVSKELDEKVVVLEKTVTKSKSVISETRNETRRAMSLRAILILIILAAVIATAFKLGFNPISIFKKFISKS